MKFGEHGHAKAHNIALDFLTEKKHVAARNPYDKDLPTSLANSDTKEMGAAALSMETMRLKDSKKASNDKGALKQLASRAEPTAGLWQRELIKNSLSVDHKIIRSLRRPSSRSTPIMNVAVELVKPVASKTTTATVLASAIFEVACKAVVAGVNPMDIKRCVDKAVKVVLEDLAAQATVVLVTTALQGLSEAPTACAKDRRKKETHGGTTLTSPLCPPQRTQW